MEVEQVDTAPVAISYKLEDPENFEKKKGSEALNLQVPATRANSKAAGFLHGPENRESAAEEHSKPQPCTITAEGYEVFTGKAFLREATHTDKPEGYSYDCYGNNADWLVDLRDKTLWDFVSSHIHLFQPSTIENSWSNYSSNNSEINDYVYAPVRRLEEFAPDGNHKNQFVTPFDLQPSISPYWILRRAFESLGYRVTSDFFSTTFFKKLCMPWVWGSFLFTEKTRFAPFKFRAMCTRAEKSRSIGVWAEWVSPQPGSSNAGDPLVTAIKWDDDSSGGTLGGFDQGLPGLYQFTNDKMMNYTYPADSVLGLVTMNFHLSIFYHHHSSSDQTWRLSVYWFVTPAGQTLAASPNTSDAVASDIIVEKEVGDAEDNIVDVNRELTINPGDTVTAILRIEASSGTYGHNWTVGQPYDPNGGGTWPGSYLENTYIKKAIGSPVNFKDYSAFKKYKFLDLLRGLIDMFNLQVGTDPVSKTVFFEPTDGYELPDGSKHEGYFKTTKVDWSGKQDLSKKSTVKLYAENNREFLFRFKEDNNDGGLAILEKRETIITGAAKYIFPERFTEGIEERENRFFSPVVHVRMLGWTNLLSNGKTPQLVALIPENISQTSSEEDGQNFEPKLCWYKGRVSDNGAWRWRPYGNAGGQTQATMPFMFAVNHQTGGENDPVLTYCDQGIGGASVPAKGLLRRFFLTRLARMRNGKLYSTWMRLKLGEAADPLQREEKIVGASSYHLIEIKDYKPLLPETVECTMWQKALPGAADDAAIAPTALSIMQNDPQSGSDLKWVQSFILETDIPKKES